MKYNDIIVLIPTFNPSKKIKDTIKILKENGFNNIIVIDDGSTNKENLQNLECSKLISYGNNKGKGGALKTGFKYIENLDFKGVITVDDDLQHNISDIKKMCNLFLEDSGVYLGCRSFDKNTPLKRKIANKLTAKLFYMLYHKKITDTQSGLRIFSKDLLTNLINIKGSGFEYETNVLKYLAINKIKVKQIPIETIYFEGPNESRYRPIKDSLRIAKVLFRKNDI